VRSKALPCLLSQTNCWIVGRRDAGVRHHRRAARPHQHHQPARSPRVGDWSPPQHPRSCPDACGAAWRRCALARHATSARADPRPPIATCSSIRSFQRACSGAIGRAWNLRRRSSSTVGRRRAGEGGGDDVQPPYIRPVTPRVGVLLRLDRGGLGTHLVSGDHLFGRFDSGDGLPGGSSRR